MLRCVVSHLGILFLQDREPTGRKWMGRFMQYQGVKCRKNFAMHNELVFMKNVK